MAQPPTGYVSIPMDQFAQLLELANKNTKEDLEGMNYTFHDKNAGTTTFHQINFRTDGNKIADAEGNTWLHVGANAGSELMISGFIQKGGKELDLDVRNQEDNTPLMIAVDAGRQKIVEILLDNGADINARKRETGWTALYRAAKNGNFGMVNLLLSRGATIIEADFYAPTYPNVLPFVIKHGYTPLLASVEKGSVDLVRALIVAGDDPHRVTSNGCNALYFAKDNVPVATMLLNEYKVNPSQKTEDGLTPLDMVSDLTLIQSLLEHGAEVDSHFFDKDYKFNDPDKIIALLKTGANPNIPPLKEHPFAIFADKGITQTNMTPSKAFEITKLFLASGAKINIDMKVNFNKYFERHPHKEFEKLIEDNHTCTIL